MTLSFSQRGPYHDRTAPPIDATTATAWDQTLADLVTAANAALPLAGGTMTGNLLLAGDPSSPLQAATRQYVDAARTGLDVKLSVRAATTANISLTGTQTIDGIALIAGDRVLVKDQTSAAQNGLWAVASGAWARTTDADADVEVTAGMFTFVESGTVNHDTGWVLQTDNPITVDVTALTFVKFSSAASASGVGSVAGVSPNSPGGNVALTGTADITVTPDDAGDNVGLALSNTSVTPGSYTNASVTLDAKGRVTGAASGTGGGGSSSGTFSAPTTVSVSYTALSTDYMIQADTTSTDIVISFPTAVGIAGKSYIVKNIGTGSHLLTLDAFGSQTFDRQLTIATNTIDDVVAILSDGANWRIITPQDAAGSTTTGTVSSVEGVTPDVGGNIDLIPGANQTITPGTNSITLAVTDDGIGSKVEDAAPVSAQYRFLAKLPIQAVSSGKAKLFIELEGGPSWFSNELIKDYMQFSNYTFFDYHYQRSGPYGTERSNLAVVAYSQSDTSVDVYLRSSASVYTSCIVRAQAKDIPLGTDYNVTPGAPGTTVPTGTVVFDSTTYPAYGNWEVGDIYQNGTPVGGTNFTPFAFPIGASHSSTLTSQTLAAAGGTIAVPVVLTSAIKLQSIEFWNMDTTLARGPAEFAIFNDKYSNTVTLPVVTGAVGTLASWTASAQAVRILPVTSPPVIIPAGVYWVTLKNNHASNTLSVGCVAQSATWTATSNSQTKNLGTGAFGSTLDLVTTWAKQTYVPNIRLQGRSFGQSVAY